MLVGRAVLLEACDRALQHALRGKGRLLLLAGEAGIGKTTLATAITDRATAAGALVRTGACWETEGLSPFTPWLQALRHPSSERCAHAAALLEGGDGGSTDATAATRALSRRFADVAQALRDEAAHQPQVLLIEDLHWADEPSVELLTAIAAHLPAMGVLVIGTYRADELPRTDAFGAIGGNAEHLWLDGLDQGAVAEVLGEVLGRTPTTAELEHVQRQTSGNPLFITQVGRLLDADRVLVPSGIRGVIDRRLARMSTDCDQVLGAAAVLGPDFDRAVIEEMTSGSIHGALDEATDAGLIVAVDEELGRWRFVHALVQAARYERLGSAERATLHRAALGALGRRGDVSAAILAHHAIRAELDAADSTPADLLVAAGNEALDRMAWADAAASFERALVKAPTGAGGEVARAAAWLGIGAARLRQGTDDVRGAFDDAAAVARRLQRPDLLARAALGFGVGLGAFEVRMVDHHQIDLLEEAAAALTGDDPLLPLVLARLSVALAFVDSDERRRALARQAVELARASGDPTVVGNALAAWADAVAGPDAVSARVDAATEIVILAERAGDLPLELLGRRLRVVALFEQNAHASVDQEIAAFERTAARLGDPLYAWYAELWRATRAHARGDLSEATLRARHAVELGAAGNSANAATLALVFSLMTSIDHREEMDPVDLAAAMSSMLPDAISAYPRITQAYLDVIVGNIDRARAGVALITEADVASLPYDSEWLCALAQLAAAAARVGDERMAALLVPLLEPVADIGCVEGIGAYMHGSAHRYVALLTAVQGNVAGTRAHVDASLLAASGGGALLEALAELDGAWALLRAGDPADTSRATELARSAAVKAAAIGMGPLAKEADVLAGGVLGGIEPRRATTTVAHGGPAVRRDGDAWAWTWHGDTVRVRHAKGVADLALLLERAGREVHVRELEGVVDAPQRSGAPQAVLDETAVGQYRQRLQDIEEDLDEADRHGDVGRAGRLAAERDALIEQLTAAFGLGGRARRLGSDPDERLRKAVSARVRASIERIDGLHPALGHHLRSSVRTGFWCSYQPEQLTQWHVERH